jgi:CRISPR-associated endonuclease/helicase Cas3
MTLSITDFAAFHEAVHGWQPFDWQSRLLEQVVEDRAWPRVLDLPTGAGKTTCIDIALFALALDAQDLGTRWCPRRIAMVVDRRIVVDQVAERGRKLLRALTSSDASTLVTEVARLLKSLSKEAEDPVGVFTLRGGIPKDDGWARSPDQPLILASTVDQLGSRLLIQGYGVSPGMRPVHAGLLGNDLLLLLDEVHLSRPFADTLEDLDRLRKHAAGPLASRFHHAFLSATPGASNEKIFRLSDHEKRADSALGPRLHVSKPVRLAEVDGRSALELMCVAEARALVKKHDSVAVIVNRVASASVIVRQLKESLGDEIDVALLTGRMRPLDRDDVLAALRSRIITGRDRPQPGRKLIVVGTQCIEAGADFDFDALVTEAASLDALRQRFGRVDRLGKYEKAEGVIIRDKSAKEDPIYGTAIASTMTWLKSLISKKTKPVDFGVLKVPVPPDDELSDMLAPKPKAPVLLPAYLDLWMQTFPKPAVVPDVSLWLHGPRSGPADVQVIWRVDLTNTDLTNADLAAQERVIEVVAAVRPSSLEAISLPYAAARRWLRGAPLGAITGEMADVEGAPEEERDDEEEGKGQGSRALRWAGDASNLISAEDLRPGDTIVVPASRGGIRDGCFDPESDKVVTDLAERAALLGRGLPVLRLHPSVLAQLELSLPDDDLPAARAELRSLADAIEAPRWRRIWLERLASSRKSVAIDASDPWIVLEGRRIRPATLRMVLQADETVEDGIELTTDEDDSFHAGREVPLAEHSKDVEHFARVYATAVGLPPSVIEAVALAAWLHDIGKADRRFQVMLRGGSEIDFFKDETPWAKSGMPPGAKAAHHLAQRRSGYPKGARHEVQSVAMLHHQMEFLKSKVKDVDLVDLVLHLVASHHGYCRPFAPVVIDDTSIEVTLTGHRSEVFGVIDVSASPSNHGLHGLGAPLADRFWGLAEKYGWLELCWLEAVLRLADHRASEFEQQEDA